MADKNQIVLELVGRTKKLEASLKRIKKQVDKAEKGFGGFRITTAKVRRSIGALRNNMLLVSFALGGTFAAVGKLISAYGNQELAERKLQQALGFTSQKLKDQASALQQTTAFGDEAILGVQSLIAAFTDDEEKIKELTKATLDLAAAKGMDLTAAADLVSKSFGSATNALSRYGITVQGAVGSTERLEMLTKNVGNLFGGQAVAQADTMTGSIDQMKNALGDTAEVMGSFFAPMVTSIAKDFKMAAESTSAFLESLKLIPIEQALISQSEEELRDQIKKRDKELLIINASYERHGLFLNKNNKEERIRLQAEKNDLEERLDFITNATDKELEADTLIQESLELIRSGRHKVNETHARTHSFLDKEPKKIENTTAAQLKAAKDREELEKKIMKEKVKNAAISSSSASEGMKTVVKAESMEAIAGLIASILKDVPFPLNTILAAGAGGLASGLIDKGLSQVPAFAEGGSFITNGDQLIRVGDNPSGRELVSVTPLDDVGQPTSTSSSSITINVSGNVLTSDFVEGELADNIREAVRRGTDFGIG